MYEILYGIKIRSNKSPRGCPLGKLGSVRDRSSSQFQVRTPSRADILFPISVTGQVLSDADKEAKILTRSRSSTNNPERSFQEEKVFELSLIHI